MTRDGKAGKVGARKQLGSHFYKSEQERVLIPSEAMRRRNKTVGVF